MNSNLERALIFYVRAAKLPLPQLQYPFAEQLGRRWRADLAWPEAKLLLEVQGGGFVQGRHTRGLGLESDCEKFSYAAILGWRVLHVTGRHIETGEAVDWIKQALETEGAQL